MTTYNCVYGYSYMPNGGFNNGGSVYCSNGQWYYGTCPVGTFPAH